jgi:hypothetical protein
VNISSKLIESFVDLVYTKNFNTTFFSKELSIQGHVIDFISMLGVLKTGTKEEREDLYVQIPKNQSYLKALK